MKRDFRSIDFILIAVVCALSVFGIIAIGSATHIAATGPSVEYTNQKFWFGSGLVLMGLALYVDYHFLCKFYWVYYAVNLILLILVWLIGKQEGNQVSRWLRIGSMGIQPSEFSKVFIILFFSAFLEKKQGSVNSFPVLLVLLALLAVPVVLIIMQPSLSAGLVVLFIGLVLIFVAGLSFKYVLPALLISLVGGALFLQDIARETPILLGNFLKDYQIDRIVSTLYPDVNNPLYYQTNQSIQAIGSGQLYGKGLYSGALIQQGTVPYAYNDFIFSVIGEELGFIGCAVVLGVLFFVIIKCFLAAHRAVDLSGKLIACGVGSMIAFQTLIHVGVTSGIIPNTGMPLPFISYGGSSLWINMVGIGLVLNVSISKTKSFFE